MAVDADLLARAYENPAGLRMEEAVRLAESLGWYEVRQRGSHRHFRHPEAHTISKEFPIPLDFQPKSDGKAKAYQVRQMLKMAEALGKIERRE